ncbi:hypothetical protein FH608_014910 [Nonomuraea phyllanthi]|uniref:Uncharacterized protein n=1 Tax=Nonomuraea phyllanthi TaxID=2219224 RepID=A0A5C4WJC1_9ACTN|nr:hypothetical protein [Nonomuraea phyllanthi]KAB8194503.1 hypothetical protein FH608_014910 [Nonomuraea phyllanthi]QFY08931.1 hypothetical protein GBF35_21660 [Nonomuraea phyllanthi]
MGVVVDPGVPPEVAGLLRANAPLLSRIRAGWVPPADVTPPRRWSPSSTLLLAATPAMVALTAVLLVSPFAPAGFMVLGTYVFIVLVKIASMNEVPEDHRPHERGVYEQARWYDGRYLLPEDFDREAGPVLARAQRAIGSVLRSHVNAEGLLDDARNAVMLPAQEWEIARLLAKLSALRLEHRELLARGIAPEVASVIEPLERALASSESAVVARVEALERYADHVADAERAYHARGQIEELRARLPRYEELLAESGADAMAVTEIERLAEDADVLERTLRRSVRSAHEAFRYLEG